MSQELTAAEAAARLGVKRATLYAYVSRGLLHRHMAMDGRTSLFDADEIESFRSGRRRSTEGELDTVISTSLTRVRDGDLRVRGRDLIAFVEAGGRYEDVVDLVWDSAPSQWHLAAEVEAVGGRRCRSALPAIDQGDRSTPRRERWPCPPRTRLRADLSPGSVRGAGRSLLLAMVASLPLLGREASSRSVAERLWPRLTARRATARTPPGARRRAGVAGRPRARGLDLRRPRRRLGSGRPLLGGRRRARRRRRDPCTEPPAEMSTTSCEMRTRPATLQRRSGTSTGDSGRNPGFGHTIYRSEDPRYAMLMGAVSRSAGATTRRLATVHAVRDLISQRTDAIANVDLALGALTWLADMEADAGEAIFAISRTAGWLAHALEEYDEQPLRFRPRARYIGRPRGSSLRVTRRLFPNLP